MQVNKRKTPEFAGNGASALTEHAEPGHGSPAYTVARKRLAVLQLAEKLGNVTEACKQEGMDRTSYYAYLRRFQDQGIEGLRDLPPVHKSHPQTTPVEVASRLMELAMQHPTRGCHFLAGLLAREGRAISGPTVQSLLVKQGLGGSRERLFRLETWAIENEIELTSEQIGWVEKNNPCFRERHYESIRPGALLAQAIFPVRGMKTAGQVYLQAVVDTFGSYAFAYLHTHKHPRNPVLLLEKEVLPFYRDVGLRIGAVVTSGGRDFHGTKSRPYLCLLACQNIEHRPMGLPRSRTNGFVENFRQTVGTEFFRPALLEKSYESLEALQSDLDRWLRYYNCERPHPGYRNMGKRPWEMF